MGNAKVWKGYYLRSIPPLSEEEVGFTGDEGFDEVVIGDWCAAALKDRDDVSCLVEEVGFCGDGVASEVYLDGFVGRRVRVVPGV